MYLLTCIQNQSVFSKGKPIRESINLAVIIAHKDTNFSEIKSILQSILRTQFKIDCKTKTSSNNQALFVKGRNADIYINDEKIGQGRENAKRYLQENEKIRNKIEEDVKAFLGMEEAE